MKRNLTIFILVTTVLFYSLKEDALPIDNQKENSRTIIQEKNDIRTKVSLIVVEYQEGYSGTGIYTHLVSYNFEDGNLIEKDTIISSTFEEIYYGCIFGGDIILDNQYVITALGNIIDLKLNSLIKEKDGRYLYRRDSILVFDSDRDIEENSYSEFNLRTLEYNKIEDEFFTSKRELHSPDDKYKIVMEDFTDKITLIGRDNTVEVLVENVYGTPMAIYSSTISNIPILWIDSLSILYADFKLKTEIRLINIKDKTNSLITTIDSIPAGASHSMLYRDALDNVIFSCSKGKFEIDIKNASHKFYKYIKLDHNFSVQTFSDSVGSEIWSHNHKIGKLWCSSYRTKVANGYIALVYGEAGSNLGYPKGVKVWSELNHKWTTIDIPRFCEIVGWYER